MTDAVVNRLLARGPFKADEKFPSAPLREILRHDTSIRRFAGRNHRASGRLRRRRF
jgi:hypothetical protein